MPATNTNGFLFFFSVIPVIIYSFLFRYTIKGYFNRSSEKMNSAFLYALAASGFGVISFVCFFYVSVLHYYGKDLQPSTLIIRTVSLYFGYAVMPMTWMAGISASSGLLEKRQKKLQVLISKLITVIVFSLNIGLAVYYGKFISNTNTNHDYTKTFKRISGINFIFGKVYFFLFASLVRHKKQFSQQELSLLFLYLVLNENRLTVDKLYISLANSSFTQLYAHFFLTDFLTVLAMLMLIYYLKITCTKVIQ